MYRPNQFINRELSWIAFNERVLEEALDTSVPLLERVKFLAIFSSNLDEFFEVRVAGLKQQMESGASQRTLDGLTATETFRVLTARIRRCVERMYVCWHRELAPELARHKIHFRQCDQLNAKKKAWLDQYYREQVRPVLTPLAIDPAHPFPMLMNKSLNLMVSMDNANGKDGKPQLAVVQVPRGLTQLVRIPNTEGVHEYLFLGQIIGNYLQDLFYGMQLQGYWLFRVTRNSELYLDDEAEASVLEAVEKELHNRRRGDAVRLEVEKGCPREIQERLLSYLDLASQDIYSVQGPMNLVRLMTICDEDHALELKYPPFVAPMPRAFQQVQDFFAVIAKKDVMVHHPYENFEATVEFLQQAAEDPDVVAIKQTLYRTGKDTRMAQALMDAARNGKQVTAVVELKARFDEANNIEGARRLEEAGVHVVFGLVGYKVHCKVCLVVRREGNRLQRYVHLSTGNYNPITSRVYTDIGLFTCRPEFGEDVVNLFNLLTGISQFHGMKKLLIAPFELHERMRLLIVRETENARKGLPARIMAKMNSLVDRQIIEALYDASKAGVQIDLLVRGICCLRPQRKDISRNIRVHSIVDRFLEHSRIFYFENACQPEVYVGSADWMPRNFFGRIEVIFPIEDGLIQERVRHEILEKSWQDNLKTRELLPNGKYQRIAKNKADPEIRSQWEFMRLSGAPNGKQTTRSKSKYPHVEVAQRPPVVPPPSVAEQDQGHTI